MAESFFLVRHGRYDRETMGLTDEGRDIDAPRALSILLAKGLGQGAVVLSSSAPRALQTAEIIAAGLSSEVISSRLIEYGGNDVWGVKDLDVLVSRALSEAEAKPLDDNGLVVVTHAPMVAAAMGRHHFRDVDNIGYGKVVEYQVGTWTNPHFRASEEI
jgi:phosphohistidine phosphatase SixA